MVLARALRELALFSRRAEGVGIALVVAGSERDANGKLGRQTVGNVGALIGLGGIATSTVGIILLTHAEAHQRDAMNIYNDGVGEGNATTPAGAAPRP